MNKTLLDSFVHPNRAHGLSCSILKNFGKPIHSLSFRSQFPTTQFRLPHKSQSTHLTTALNYSKTHRCSSPLRSYTKDAERDIILRGVEQAVQNQQFSRQRSMSTKSIFVIFLLSTVTGISIYVIIRLRRDEKAYVPLWINSKTRKLAKNEVNIKELKDNAEYKLLEKLAMYEVVKNCFGLPLSIDECSEFDIWAENKHPTVSGLEFSPESFKPKWVAKSVKFKEILEDLMGLAKLKKIKSTPPSNIHEVPLLDFKGENLSDKTYDICFLGITKIQSIRHNHKNGHNYDQIGNDNVINRYYEEGKVVFAGKVDFDHVNQVKITSADLIVQDENNGVIKIKLW